MPSILQVSYSFRHPSSLNNRDSHPFSQLPGQTGIQIPSPMHSHFHPLIQPVSHLCLFPASLSLSHSSQTARHSAGQTASRAADILTQSLLDCQINTGRQTSRERPLNEARQRHKHRHGHGQRQATGKQRRNQTRKRNAEKEKNMDQYREEHTLPDSHRPTSQAANQSFSIHTTQIISQSVNQSNQSTHSAFTQPS